ncbi:MAG: metallophosphoesterase family protein [Actinobacteria bacterium]|nr:metallophosphoesterase family protein [Actinomycetota bacterium]
MRSNRLVRPLALAGAGVLAWGHFEAGWVRLRTLSVRLPRLPPALEGMRIAHLSDFHLGVPSRGASAVERGVAWAAERQPDLVCITGDLLSHPRGQRTLRHLLERIPGSFAVLGNHDYGVARDPFARRADPYDARPARLLADEAATVDIRGCSVQLVGVDPRSHMQRQASPERLADPAADLRILLCHFPRIVERIEPGAFDLVLAGHLHDGQITVPYGLGKLRLAHPRFPYPAGLYRRPEGLMHVSPGLGTTFVPFRFFARPEATELVLQSE